MFFTKNRFLLIFFLLLLYTGCSSKYDSIEGQWKVVEGTHFKQGEEAWLEVFEGHFTLIGPVPDSDFQCLEKLTLEMKEYDQHNDGIILINPEYRSEQFLLTIQSTDSYDDAVNFNIKRKNINIEFTAIQRAFVKENLDICSQ